MSGRTESGTLDHRIAIENPGAPVSDGDGGFTQSWTKVVSAAPDGNWWASIVPATVRDLERRVAGTVLATVSHVVTLRYNAAVLVTSRITYESRIFNVTGVVNPDEDDLETIALCVEVVP